MANNINRSSRRQEPNSFLHLQQFGLAAVLSAGIVAVGLWAVQANDIKASDNAVLGFLAITTIIIAFAGIVLWKMVSGEIDLSHIVSEPVKFDADGNRTADSGKTSLSRFQFLLFTFVIAGLFLMLSIEAGAFVNIPSNVLGLIGISGGSYVISKAVGQQTGNVGQQTANNASQNQDNPRKANNAKEVG